MPPMETELRVYWDGDAPGLADHRLSLSAFGLPLQHLLRALRRIAAAKAASGFEFREASSAGRMPKVASLIDIEIGSLREGSLDLELRCRLHQPPGESMPMFLLDQSVDELMNAIEEESRGVSRQRLVRKFLDSMPAGVQSQRYTLYRGGQEIRTVSFGKAELPQMIHLPRFRRVEGEIIGLGFEPGRSEVRLQVGKSTLTCPATVAQVEKALDLRGEPVRAMLLASERRVERLLWLRAAGEPPARLTDRQVDDYLCDRWDGTLRELAK